MKIAYSDLSAIVYTWVTIIMPLQILEKLKYGLQGGRLYLKRQLLIYGNGVQVVSVMMYGSFMAQDGGQRPYVSKCPSI